MMCGNQSLALCKFGIQTSFHPLFLILTHLVFKPHRLSARAGILGGARALPEADARVPADKARHAAGLAKAHPVLFRQSAVVARGELAREVDVALGVLLVAFAQRFFRERKQDAYPFVDYFANALLLRHGKNLHWRLIKTSVGGKEKRNGPDDG